MENLRIEGLAGKAYTLLAYSKALKQEVRLVIWIMPNRKHKLFFSTKLTMTGEEVLRTYRSRIQIEFCFRDAKQFVGLAHCQGQTHISTELLLQRILCCLECGQGYDEGK